jgi:hypothetical protein
MNVNGIAGLYRLANLNAQWASYFADAHGNVYSVRTSAVPRKMMGSVNGGRRYFTLTGNNGRAQTVAQDQLIRDLRNKADFIRETSLTPAVQAVVTNREAAGQRNHAASLAAGVKAKGYIIGRVQGEAFAFGSKPAIHTTLLSVRSEMERLATANPGVEYVYFKIEGSVKAASLAWS